MLHDDQTAPPFSELSLLPEALVAPLFSEPPPLVAALTLHDDCPPPPFSELSLFLEPPPPYMSFVILARIFCVCQPVYGCAPQLDRLLALDEKLERVDGEDETRIVKLIDPKTGTLPPISPSMLCSFVERWLRACNDFMENFERAATGKRIDGCPRLTHARRLVARSTPQARETAREQKRAWRQDPEVKKREARQKKQWRLEHNDNDKALRKADYERARDRNYHRPFVATDFEGMNYADNDVTRDGVLYPDHGLFLMGTGGMRRDENDNFHELPIEWLCHVDKRRLRGDEILDRLLSLPERHGPAIFGMFAMSYDVTQILKALEDLGRSKEWHFKKVYEICKREKYALKRVVKGAVYCGDYAIDYIKGKRLVIKKIERGEDGKIHSIKRITIYDVFGFYQTSFAEVVESLVPLGLATREEVESIKRDKARREQFHQIPLDEIKPYTTLELRKLSIAVTILRDGFDKMGIRLNSWMGAGAAASALLRKEGVAKHYAGIVRKHNISTEQEIAHAGFHAGRIELIKHGFAKDQTSYQSDKVSAYASVCLNLPSMIDGQFEWKKMPVWDEVEKAGQLSEFFIKWNFPEVYLDQNGELRNIPFYPLPYRLPGGGILYPRKGSGWYYRDDAIAAKRWLEKFASLGAAISKDGLPVPISAKAARQMCLSGDERKSGFGLIVTEAVFFHVSPEHAQDRPYAFVQRYFDERARIKERIKATGVYDIAEKAIKLTLSALYGKAAQSIGGSEDKPPVTACPWYAGAITAGTRRAVLEAALHAPHDVVQFMTDGVHLTRPVPELGDGEKLGDWEASEVHDLLCLQSGVYSSREMTKTRGMRPETLKDEGISMRDMLMQKVLPAWRASTADPFDPTTWPSVEFLQKEYVTAGSAVASRKRFELIGRWGLKPRKIDVHGIGLKRSIGLERAIKMKGLECALEEWAKAYFSTPDREADRCHTLVETIPMEPPPELDVFNTPSKPYRPKWLDEDLEFTLDNDWAQEDDLETAEVMLGL
jgi:hypothetical protein